MTELLITSSILILAITLVRTLLRRRVGARLIYALWLVAALRLLLPFSLVSSPVSVMNAAPEAEHVIGGMSDVRVPAAVVNDPVPVTNPAPCTGDAQISGENSQSVAQSVREPVSLVPDVDWDALLPAAWLAGSCVCAAYILIVNGALYFRLRGARRRIEIPDAKLPVYLVRELPSPCLHGVFRPAIYLTPAALENKERTHMAVLHEQTHYRHGDHIWALLRCILLCIYWFDPFVWLAAHLSRRDAELACDESCVRALGDERRIDYGTALVDLLDRTGRRVSMLNASTTMSGGKRSMRERLTRIVKAPKTCFAAVAAALLLVVTAAACTFTGAEDTGAEYLSNPTAFTRIDGTTIYSFDEHGYEYDSVTNTTTLTWADGYTSELSTPTGLEPAVFMSDTLSAVAYVDTMGRLNIALSPERGNWEFSTVSDRSYACQYLLTGFSTTKTGWIYLAGREVNSRLWLTEDGGETWVEAPVDMLPDGVTGIAVAPNGDVYVSAAGQSPNFEGADSFDGEITSLCPRATAEGIEFPFLLMSADGSSSTVETYLDLRSPYCNLSIPAEFTQSGTAVEIANGVWADFATDEKLAQFWRLENFDRDADSTAERIVLYTNDDTEVSCGFFGTASDGSWDQDNTQWYAGLRRGIGFVIPLDVTGGAAGVALRFGNDYYYSVTSADGALSVEENGTGSIFSPREIVAGILSAQRYPVMTQQELEALGENITVVSPVVAENVCCALLSTPLYELTLDIVLARTREDGEVTYVQGESTQRYTLTRGEELALYVPDGAIGVAARLETDNGFVTFGFYADEDGKLRYTKLTEPGDTGHGVSISNIEDLAAFSGEYITTGAAGSPLYNTELTFYGTVTDFELFSLLYNTETWEYTRGETFYADAAPEAGTSIGIGAVVVGDLNASMYGMSFKDSGGYYYEYRADAAAATMVNNSVPAVIPMTWPQSFEPADTGYGVLANVATEVTLSEFDAWDSVDASLGAEQTADVLLYSTTSISSLRVFTLDYSAEYIVPTEGETIYAKSGLWPARPIVLTLPRGEGSSRIGFAFTDANGIEHGYFVNFYSRGDVMLCWLWPGYDTQQEDFDTGYGLRVNYASREILDRYENTVIVPGFTPEQEYVALLALMADERLTNLRYFELAYGEDSFTPQEGPTLYDYDVFTADDLLIVGNLSPGEIRQTRGIAFTDAYGVEHKYMILPNNENGSIGLFEMD